MCFSSPCSSPFRNYKNCIKCLLLCRPPGNMRDGPGKNSQVHRCVRACRVLLWWNIETYCLHHLFMPGSLYLRVSKQPNMRSHVWIQSVAERMHKKVHLLFPFPVTKKWAPQEKLSYISARKTFIYVSFSQNKYRTQSFQRWSAETKDEYVSIGNVCCFTRGLLPFPHFWFATFRLRFVTKPYGAFQPEKVRIRLSVEIADLNRWISNR